MIVDVSPEVVVSFTGVVGSEVDDEAALCVTDVVDSGSVVDCKV